MSVTAHLGSSRFSRTVVKVLQLELELEQGADEALRKCNRVAEGAAPRRRRRPPAVAWLLRGNVDDQLVQHPVVCAELLLQPVVVRFVAHVHNADQVDAQRLGGTAPRGG